MMLIVNINTGKYLHSDHTWIGYSMKSNEIFFLIILFILDLSIPNLS